MVIFLNVIKNKNFTFFPKLLQAKSSTTTTIITEALLIFFFFLQKIILDNNPQIPNSPLVSLIISAQVPFHGIKRAISNGREKSQLNQLLQALVFQRIVIELTMSTTFQMEYVIDTIYLKGLAV